MAWTTVFGPDPFTATQFTALPTYNAAYAQDVANGAWRISSNGTSAGCTVIATARCYLVSAPGNNQAAEYTVNGSTPDRTWGLVFRFTDGDSGNFWGGTGYVGFNDASQTRLRIERLDGGGSHTQLSTGAYTPTSGDTFRGELVGSSIALLINGAGKVSTTDATYTSGTVGLWGGDSIDDLTNVSVDNFTVYQESAAAGLTWGVAVSWGESR